MKLAAPAATMEAAVVVAPGRAEIRRVGKPPPGPCELRIRVEGCGVCGSNVPLLEGRPWFRYPSEPGAPGHEGWGVVDCVGDGVSAFVEGQRVAFLSDHAFAEYDVAAVGAVVALPPELDGEPVPLEPLGCAVNVARRAGFAPDQTVGIVGAGFLGLLTLQLALAAGAEVVMVARRPEVLAFAGRFGGIGVRTGDALAEVEALTGGRLLDVVVEATGHQEPLDLAAQLLRERGRLVVAGFHQDGPRTVDMQLWNWRGIDVINAHERERSVYVDGMGAAVELLLSGDLDPAPLYTHRVPLEQADAAFALVRERPFGFVKALVEA